MLAIEEEKRAKESQGKHSTSPPLSELSTQNLREFNQQQDHQIKWKVNKDDSQELAWFKKAFQTYEAQLKETHPSVGEKSFHTWMSWASLSLWSICIAVYVCAILGSIYSLPVFVFFEFILSPQIVLACMGVLFIVDCLTILLIQNNSLRVVGFALKYKDINEYFGDMVLKELPRILRKRDEKEKPHQSIRGLVPSSAVHYDHNVEEVEEKEYQPILSSNFISDVKPASHEKVGDGVKVPSESKSREPSESPASDGTVVRASDSRISESDTITNFDETTVDNTNDPEELLFGKSSTDDSNVNGTNPAIQ